MSVTEIEVPVLLTLAEATAMVEETPETLDEVVKILTTRLERAEKRGDVAKANRTRAWLEANGVETIKAVKASRVVKVASVKAAPEIAPEGKAAASEAFLLAHALAPDGEKMRAGNHASGLVKYHASEGLDTFLAKLVGGPAILVSADKVRDGRSRKHGNDSMPCYRGCEHWFTALDLVNA